MEVENANGGDTLRMEVTDVRDEYTYLVFRLEIEILRYADARVY